MMSEMTVLDREFVSDLLFPPHMDDDMKEEKCKTDETMRILFYITTINHHQVLILYGMNAHASL